ncbi:MAG TPA: IS66 family transposase [Acidobacteriota bacterium]|nr:IS66 family transposase [Acidobacteriota bacterium]
MTRDEALAILDMERQQAVEVILFLAQKAERYDKEHPDASPTTPSGMIPIYLKPVRGKRRRAPGRKEGHPGLSRQVPQKIDHHEEHTLRGCPICQTPVGKPIKTYCRIIEDIPEVKPEVTEHTVHGYWCKTCKKIVYPTVSDALPNAMIGLRLIVFTAWLHYLVGVSVSNLVRMVAVFSCFKISAGGLTQGWKSLANLLASLYDHMGHRAAQSAVLHADETGWRLNGKTFWLWCFTTREFCYYLITKSRGSPVVKQVLGILFEGILICDFWGAYNKIDALAKQRCFFHLFTELVKVDKHNQSLPWKAFRKKLYRLLKDAIRLSEKREQMDFKRYDHLKARLYDRLDQFLTASYGDADARRLIKRLRRHKQELFTFLEHPEVSPYNNHAEQQMRKPVLVRRVSQQNRSDEGANTQAILMSLFRSAELQGNNPVEMILEMAKMAIEKKDLPTVFFKQAA